MKFVAWTGTVQSRGTWWSLWVDGYYRGFLHDEDMHYAYSVPKGPPVGGYFEGTVDEAKRYIETVVRMEWA